MSEVKTGDVVQVIDFPAGCKRHCDSQPHGYVSTAMDRFSGALRVGQFYYLPASLKVLITKEELVDFERKKSSQDQRTELSEEQCFELNALQHNRNFHGYTCGKDSKHRPLIATRIGWRCADCSYTQQYCLTDVALANPALNQCFDLKAQGKL
jgi:hypothetical protein